MRTLFLPLILCTALPLAAAERLINFSEFPLDKPPAGFRSTVAGRGKPGDWKVILDDAPATSNAPPTTGRAVLAQLAREAVDLHFPILLLEGETFGDFKLETRFKIVGGGLEQMAGVVFHFQNETNFYVVRANALNGNFRCYKVENGILKPAIGPDLEVTKGVWHDLAVQCEGNRIVCSLDGRELIKLIDNTKSAGRIGFWTKSDAISYFKDTKLTYKPRLILAQVMVDEGLKHFSRLQGLRIYAPRAAGEKPAIVASGVEKEIGQPGGDVEERVIRGSRNVVSRTKQAFTVTVPLLDRNGEAMAALQVVSKAFPGETEDTALAKAAPVLKDMQLRAQSLEDLLQ